MSLPDGRLIAFYGDDFTGSAATMEVLTFAGLPTVLFLDTPTEAQVSRFADYRGIGVAGVARAKSPKWMEDNLPDAFAALERLKAPIAHYKVCSTFDSAPHVGSIGKAIDLAAPVLGGDHPLLKMPNVVCMPHLGWTDWETFELYFRECFEQIAAFADGKPLRLMNPDVTNRAR